jgi:hypothetical protein
MRGAVPPSAAHGRAEVSTLSALLLSSEDGARLPRLTVRKQLSAMAKQRRRDSKQSLHSGTTADPRRSSSRGSLRGVAAVIGAAREMEANHAAVTALAQARRLRRQSLAGRGVRSAAAEMLSSFENFDDNEDRNKLVFQHATFDRTLIRQHEDDSTVTTVSRLCVGFWETRGAVAGMCASAAAAPPPSRRHCI